MHRIVLVLSMLTVLAAGGAVWAGYSFLREEFPDVSLLRNRYPVVTHQGRNRPPLVRLQKAPPPAWTPLAEVSKPAVGAIVVSEDWAFFQHKGYDAQQMKEALREDIAEGRFARGASTITQQVVKNVFLERDKSLWRKLRELILAVRLESHVGKRKILETYLNIAEWGEGIYGIRAAAGHYFGKSPSELNAKEGAFLAMLLPSPIRYGQSFRAKRLTIYADRTIRSIIEKMARAQYLTEAERNDELGRRLPFESDGPLGTELPEELDLSGAQLPPEIEL
ncbi:MAG: transglycosylase domain-containing protein [Oligoflexia bacterium]|nr:transglycosylase domain-containing protein [Oligoflexia bacterium]